ncbi:MAG: transposase [Thermodesulfobacteriota bacterium]|nr:transposase [Thermodesulfobacteriota bacterium]
MRRRIGYTSLEKVRILQRHLLNQVLASDLCDEPGLQPTVFCRWQKEFFEHGSAAFERQGDGKERQYQRCRRKPLEDRIRLKTGVFAEFIDVLFQTFPEKKVVGF